MSENQYRVPGSGEIVDLKYLYNRISELEGTIERMKRTYEDLLYNLDFDNLEPVSTRKPLESTIEEVFPDGTKHKSSIQVNAEKIATKVSADFNDAIEINATENADMQEYLKNEDKTKLYYRKADGTYWYWSTVTNQWQESSTKNIYSAFTQTADGFKFKGDMETTTQSGNRVTVSDSYIRVHGQETMKPKLQLGFVKRSGEPFDYLNGEFPQIILGAGTIAEDENGAGSVKATNGQFIIQKYTDGAVIYYCAEKSNQKFRIFFDDSGVDFSEADVYGLQTKGAGTHNHGIPDGTILLTSTGSVEWSASGSHAHVVQSSGLHN